MAEPGDGMCYRSNIEVAPMIRATFG